VAVDATIAHARQDAPAECCGCSSAAATTIVRPSPRGNIAAAPPRFLIDPKDHIDRRRDGDSGLDVLGFYHSHPRSPALPSETDRAEAAYSDHLYFIVSLANDEPDLRLFRYAEGNFLAVPFVTVA
jgi:proteasome lid subunit RPN8/RPN11